MLPFQVNLREFTSISNHNSSTYKLEGTANVPVPEAETLVGLDGGAQLLLTHCIKIKLNKNFKENIHPTRTSYHTIAIDYATQTQNSA